ncbi:MAG TPA: hypothetical protein DDX39_02470 [Bacteroidales bacterium]|nr:MAG: hypothetical protein A2W98_03485 [Bacteroidetes bacterium GWF2_33_38]OFY67930.1 MAG: hypothetical protein A2265_03530 [Bacteroidetes bacterium RIFOXYA12_FULL_33_9]OFY85282.1 MAG: hypothetical protein A2236_11345 [Bacteroidetes bacterium RIFOXYA2_FULL_33_7]HBF87480.1 hypothetical protein [Bacteroidales bacterium]
MTNYGDIWLTQNTALKCIKSNDTLNYQYVQNTNDNYPYVTYVSIYYFDFDSNNNKWLTTSKGLCKLDSNFNFINCDLDSNLRFTKIRIDNYDNKWMTTTSNDGLVRYNNGNWQIFNTSNSDIPSDTIFEIEVDTSENIWLATNEGLTKYDGNTWVAYNMENSNIEDSYIQLYILMNRILNG